MPEACRIDFSLCGFGYFLFDSATSLGSLGVALREPLIRVYRAERTLPRDLDRQIEACMIISRRSSYGFAPRSYAATPLATTNPLLVAALCPLFRAGEHFWLAVRSTSLKWLAAVMVEYVCNKAPRFASCSTRLAATQGTDRDEGGSICPTA
jgi:hypothetical protein